MKNACPLPFVLLVLLVSACATAPQRAEPRAPAPAAGRAGWTYEIVAAKDADSLAIEASFAPGTERELTVEEGGEPFVKDVELADGPRWKRIAPEGLSWFAPSCARGCRVRYRFALREAGRANRSVAVARASAGAVEAAPSTWLLRPVRAPIGTPFRLHVTSAPGEAFASGVFPVPGLKDTYEGKNGPVFQLPYAAFGKLRVHDLEDGRLQVAILPGALPHEAEMLAWAGQSARVVESFYGRFPVPRLLVVARPASGDGVGFGTAIGNSGAAIAIDVGDAATQAEFREDWVLVHEMIHTALPDLRGPHHWLEEGLSTYVEPLARSRAGLVRPEELWSDWVRGMPNGLPGPGDQGLDVTHTWGRTYWGGALFCLLADLEIRTRTAGKKSLDDALRAIVAGGGNIAATWTIDQVIGVGDGATETNVLRELYDKMATAPMPVNLEDIWKRLGVVPRGRGAVGFDDAAPLAAVRRAMTTPPSNALSAR